MIKSSGIPAAFYLYSGFFSGRSALLRGPGGEKQRRSGPFFRRKTMKKLLHRGDFFALQPSGI
jgi:hypothetical protein